MSVSTNAEIDPRSENEKLRTALMWVFDRMSLAVGSPEGMTVKEQRDTHREVGYALMGRASRATKSQAQRLGPKRRIDARS